MFKCLNATLFFKPLTIIFLEVFNLRNVKCYSMTGCSFKTDLKRYKCSRLICRHISNIRHLRTQKAPN